MMILQNKNARIFAEDAFLELEKFFAKEGKEKFDEEKKMLFLLKQAIAKLRSKEVGAVVERIEDDFLTLLKGNKLSLLEISVSISTQPFLMIKILKDYESMTPMSRKICNDFIVPELLRVI